MKPLQAETAASAICTLRLLALAFLSQAVYHRSPWQTEDRAIRGLPCTSMPGSMSPPAFTKLLDLALHTASHSFLKILRHRLQFLKIKTTNLFEIIKLKLVWNSLCSSSGWLGIHHSHTRLKIPSSQHPECYLAMPAKITELRRGKFRT